MNSCSSFSSPRSWHRPTRWPPETRVQDGEAYLSIPIKNDTRKRRFGIWVDGTLEAKPIIELASAEPDRWAFLDIRGCRGKTVTPVVDEFPEHAAVLDQIEQSDEIKGAEPLYRERLRPQFHFSSKRGWINDQNGLVFFRGEYPFLSALSLWLARGSGVSTGGNGRYGCRRLVEML